MGDLVLPTLEELEGYSEEALVNYVDQQVRLLDEAEDKLQRLNALEAIIRTEGASYASMEAILAICPEVESDLYPINSFTQEPSQVNVGYATESLIAATIGAVVLVILQAVAIIAAVLLLIRAALNKSFDAIKKGIRENRVVKPIIEMADKVASMIRELKAKFGNVPAPEEFNIRQDAVAQQALILERYSAQMDKMLVTGEGGYTNENISIAIEFYGRCMNDLLDMGDVYMQSLEFMLEKARPDDNSITKVLSELEELYVSPFLAMGSSTLYISRLLKTANNGELTNVNVVNELGNQSDEVVFRNDGNDDFWNGRWVYEKKMDTDAVLPQQIQIFNKPIYQQRITEGWQITIPDISACVDEQQKLAIFIEEIERFMKAVTKRGDRLKRDYEKRVKEFPKATKARAREWGRTKYNPHGVIWPAVYKGIRAGSGDVPPGGAIDNGYYRANQFPGEIMKAGTNLISKISKVFSVMPKLINDAKVPIQRRARFLDDSITYYEMSKEDNKRYVEALEKWKANKEVK